MKEIRYRVVKKCIICEKKFLAKKDCKSRNQSFCGKQCYYNSLKGKKSTGKQLEALKTGRYKGKKIGGWKWTKESRVKVSGENGNNWQNGKTKVNIKIRNSLEMKEWKKEVLKRDSYTCQICGVKGGKLIVDHIKPFSLFPDLRFDINNGRVICKKCDLKSDTYGGRAIKIYV